MEIESLELCYVSTAYVQVGGEANLRKSHLKIDVFCLWLSSKSLSVYSDNDRKVLMSRVATRSTNNRSVAKVNVCSDGVTIRILVTYTDIGIHPRFPDMDRIVLRVSVDLYTNY